MAFEVLKILKGLIVKEENTLTPKQIAVTPGGTASTTTTVTSSQTVDRTLTLPDATDTLAGISATQTLTNKTIDGASNTLTNIPAANLDGVVPIANGGTGEATRQDALNALAGAVTSGLVLRGDGADVTLSAIQVSDVPTLNQNTTGTAANITDTSNSTLTTLSSLSLPGSQVTGNISGNAANVTGTVAIANGGTGQITQTAAFDALAPTTTKADIIVHNGTNNIRLPVGTDGQTLVADSSQASGLAYKYISGVKNYITNGEAEASTSGWVTYADAAGPVPVDGTGGTVTGGLVIARNTATPLRGAASFLISKSASNTQGEGVSYDFVIDDADKAKVLNISFDYFSGSGYADGDLVCYIYDITNSQIIQPAGFVIQNATVNMKQIATFQTASNSVNYRLIIHFATTSTTNTGFLFDNVIVGPQIVTNGAAITDWIDYAPVTSGLGVVAFDIAKWRRVGDSVQMMFRFTTGTVAASVAQISPPSSVGSFDVSTTTEIGEVTGHASSPLYALSALTNGNKIEFGTAGAGLSSQNGTVFGNGNLYSFTTETIPVTGWSSNIQLSSDTDTRVVAATIYQTSASISPNTPFAWYGAKAVDTHNAMDGANGKYVVPVPGIYEVSVHALTSAPVDLGVAKNGTVAIYVASLTTAMNHVGGGTTLLECVAGDEIQIFGNTATTMTGSYSSFSVRRLSGPSVIAASETVACNYTQGTASVTSSFSTITFGTKVKDTHNFYSGGIATIPSAGTYMIEAAPWVNGTYVAGSYSQLSIFVNGIEKKTTLVFGDASVNYTNPTVCLSGYPLFAGDTIEIKVLASAGVTSPGINFTVPYSSFSIVRVGN